MEFGARRAHGPQAGLYAARAAVIGGCIGTSHVLAGKLLGVPVIGTQAHSWIMSFGSEAESFEAYSEVYPNNTICLIDTYDTLQGARNAAGLKEKLAGVRLDSGDLLTLSRRVRTILDEAGLSGVQLVGSGDLNEYAIRDLVAAGAPFDLFGVGTDLVTSKDAPALSMVYKLVEVEDCGGMLRSVRKFSTEKSTLGGAKQIFRQFDGQGKMKGDILGLAGEHIDGTPLLEKYFSQGELVHPLPAFGEICGRAKLQLASIPERLHEIIGKGDYTVELSARLMELQKTEVCSEQ